MSAHNPELPTYPRLADWERERFRQLEGRIRELERELGRVSAVKYELDGVRAQASAELQRELFHSARWILGIVLLAFSVLALLVFVTTLGPPH